MSSALFSTLHQPEMSCTINMTETQQGGVPCDAEASFLLAELLGVPDLGCSSNCSLMQQGSATCASTVGVPVGQSVTVTRTLSITRQASGKTDCVVTESVTKFDSNAKAQRGGSTYFCPFDDKHIIKNSRQAQHWTDSHHDLIDQYLEKNNLQRTDESLAQAKQSLTLEMKKFNANLLGQHFDR
jgi:hypothetical protein